MQSWEIHVLQDGVQFLSPAFLANEISDVESQEYTRVSILSSIMSFYSRCHTLRQRQIDYGEATEELSLTVDFLAMGCGSHQRLHTRLGASLLCF